MKRWDLIVIGTGLAGLTAARTAVEMGARVLVVGRGMGSLALFGNTIDVLGAVPPGMSLETGVADWIGIDSKQCYKMYIQSDFFLGFTYGGLFDNFAKIDKSPWNRPAVGRISTLNQYYGAVREIGQLNNDIGGEQGGNGFGHSSLRK